jgi:hypothetical protein
MIVNLFFSTDEIRRFFERNGFEVVSGTFGRGDSAHHNRSAWHEYAADAVVINGKQAEASKLFEKVTEARLKRLVAPHNEGMKTLIEQTFQNFAK